MFYCVEPDLQMETDVVPPDSTLRHSSNVLDGLPRAPLADHQVIGEGELGHGQPRAVGEDVEPGGGGPAGLQAGQVDTDLLPQDSSYERVLYLDNLRAQSGCTAS